jgi:GGDEF domain-containing protein
MQLSGLEAQIFIGIAVILGCAFVALLCDYLKGVNERLREHALELTVRMEETERWGQRVMAMSAQQPAPASNAEPGATVPAQDVKEELSRLYREVEQVSRSVASLAELRAAMGEAVPAASAPVSHQQPEFEPALVSTPAAAGPSDAMRAATVENDLPPLQPVVALADRPAASALPFVAELTEPVPVARTGDAAPAALPIHTPALDSLQDLIQRFAEKPAAEPRANVMKIRVLRDTPTLPVSPEADPVAPEPAAVAAPPPAPAPVESAMPELPARLQTPVAPEAHVPPALVQSAQPGEFALPSGLHDHATLEFLRADTSLFSGLVVAIGLNDFEQLKASVGAEAADDLVRSVGQLVKSLTSNLGGPQFFAAKGSDDEFILAFNGENGPAAQRRMAAVSERLWDFQLRSIGTYSVVFSWGASEANDETFADAVDAALERMRETRQNRKAMGGEKGRKRVVA